MGDLFTALDWIGAVLIAIALAMTALGPREIVAFRMFLLLGAGLIVLRWVMWGFTTDVSWPYRALIGGILGSLLLAGLPAALHWATKREGPSHSVENVPAPLLASQIEEMTRLQHFLGSTTEGELRALFDLTDMMFYNTMWLRQALFPNSVSVQQANAINSYFSGGIVLADSNNVPHTVQADGTYAFSFDAKRVPAVRASKKYLESTKQLQEFSDSVVMPQSVHVHIVELLNIIRKDTGLFMIVMREVVRDDPGSLKKDQATLSADENLPINKYWSKFTPLKPTTDKIINAIQSYLSRP